MKARSLWYTGTRKLEVRPIEIPDPGPGEVLVELSACGICTWDLFIYSGRFQGHCPFPFYFGHEGVGRVIACGEGTSIAENQRVALREASPVGKLGGGHMAEYAVHRADTLIRLPEDDVPDHEFMVEPAACCVNALNIAPVLPGQRVALVGAGYMGSILLQLFLDSPAKEIVVYERRSESLEYARSLSPNGPLRVVDSRVAEDDTLSADAGTFDLVAETTGVESGFRVADRLVRAGGRLVIFSWQHDPFLFDFGTWHERGLTVYNTSPIASWDFGRCYRQATELLHGRRIDQSRLVTHVGTLDQAAEIYEHGLAKTDGYIKGVIRFLNV